MLDHTARSPPIEAIPVLRYGSAVSIARWCLGVLISSWLSACLGERPPGDASAGGGAGNTGANTSSGNGGGAGDGDSGVVSGLGTQLEFEPLPQPAYVSRPLGPITVRILDAGGTVVSGAEGTITLALADNPGGANLIGYVTAPARAGLAVFDTVGLNQAGTGYTLTASASGLDTAVSPAFDVVRQPFERVVTGLYGGNISHIALSGEDPPTLYAASPAGVFRSNNLGGSWGPANFGNAGAVGLVAIDPQNPARVYSTPAFGSISFEGARALVARSDSAGDAWRPLDGLSAGGLSGGDVGAFAIHPESPNIVYAGNLAGIFRSTDAGESWVQTSFPFANFELTIDPIAPTTLYASAYDRNTSTAQGIYKTVDSGNNWAPVNNPSLPTDIIPNGPQALLATPAGVLVNEYRSTDGGATWIAGASSARAYAYSRSNVQRVYAAEGAYVRVSNDGGQTFGPDFSPNIPINSLAVDGVDADRVYAATENGVFVSSDAAASWSNVSIGITTLLLFSVALNPAAPDNVVVGGRGGVYTTNNGGVTWPYIELGSGLDEVTALGVDPVNPEIVYACTSSATFHRSDDGGVNWSAGVDTGGFSFCYDIAVSGSTVWLPTSGGIRRSLDGGASWEAASRLDYACYSVAVAPDGSALYAGCSEGTFKSVNQGVDWTLMTTDLADAFLIDPITPSSVYMGLGCGSVDVATGSGGIRRSTNAGTSWEPVVNGACITSLLRLADGRLLAVGQGFPAYAVSADQGVSWQAAGIGIEGEPTDVAASSDGQTLYVPTTLGLYKSVTSGL
jgi:photosystem II stability/assembly factor-like uncharacterized protein